MAKSVFGGELEQADPALGRHRDRRRILPMRGDVDGGQRPGGHLGADGVHVEAGGVHRDRHQLRAALPQRRPGRPVADRLDGDPVTGFGQGPAEDGPGHLAAGGDHDVVRRRRQRAGGRDHLRQSGAKPRMAGRVPVAEQVLRVQPQRPPEGAGQLVHRDRGQVGLTAAEVHSRRPGHRGVRRRRPDRQHGTEARHPSGSVRRLIRQAGRHVGPARGCDGEPPLGGESVVRRYHRLPVHP